jgi:glyoxylate utilization-related uncharacterized protein
MVKLMKGLIQEFKREREESKMLKQQLTSQRERAQQRLEEDMAYCQSLAMECGASEESIEFWMASKLFEKQSQRAFFKNIKMKEARFMWLKRHYQNVKLY